MHSCTPSTSSRSFSEPQNPHRHLWISLSTRCLHHCCGQQILGTGSKTNYLGHRYPTHVHDLTKLLHHFANRYHRMSHNYQNIGSKAHNLLTARYFHLRLPTSNGSDSVVIADSYGATKIITHFHPGAHDFTGQLQRSYRFEDLR